MEDSEFKKAVILLEYQRKLEAEVLTLREQARIIAAKARKIEKMLGPDLIKEIEEWNIVQEGWSVKPIKKEM